jgi:hypothetical protein
VTGVVITPSLIEGPGYAVTQLWREQLAQPSAGGSAGPEATRTIITSETLRAPAGPRCAKCGRKAIALTFGAVGVPGGVCDDCGGSGLIVEAPIEQCATCGREL